MSYFCDTYASWQKGGVENKLNNRPRKKLGYLTPNEALAAYLSRRQK